MWRENDPEGMHGSRHRCFAAGTVLAEEGFVPVRSPGPTFNRTYVISFDLGNTAHVQ